MYDIAAVPGDGVGPPLLGAGRRVLDRACDLENVAVAWTEHPYGADHYLETGAVLPDAAVEEFRAADAIYFGSVGDPRVEPGVLERGVVLALRFALDQYVNLRPVDPFEGVETPYRDRTGVAFDVVRENTEGLYVGLGDTVRGGTGTATHDLDRRHVEATVDVATETDSEALAYQFGVASREGTERVLRYGFERAAAAGHDTVTVVDKANVMPDAHGLWRTVAREVAAEYAPGVEFLYADAAAMEVVRDPGRFETVVAPNLLGDVLTDLAATHQGGLGLSPGANIAPGGTSLFEPVHGSAPDIAGEGVANPTATIWAGALMFDHLGESGVADRVLAALRSALAAGDVRTPDLGGDATTAAFTDAVLAELE